MVCAFHVCTCRSKEFDEDCSPPKKMKPNPMVAGSLKEKEEEQKANVSGRQYPEHDSSPSRQTPSGSSSGGALLRLSAYSDSDSDEADET